MKYPIPDSALAQHIAVLGKTGSGKTSTAKLIIEHVVAGGARVCILDPVKSDWWGLTSSSDGKRAGLPFQILGGPHGHVPLHPGAGTAIGELVATAALPLSIIDMADFGPGGPSKFFAQFAQALMRKMRGVLYLVMEEAHEFAPKERSGIGEENIAVYYAKKLATAGRSKGLRMIVATQRTQALHNALLGSCDTMIVHRMTAPADQEPVEKWLKKNVKDRGLRTRVEESLSSLKTGTGWLCSGEAATFELVPFPRIATFDNSATPSGDGEEISVRTAMVDRDALRALIGNAVQEAEANDPGELKKRIRELEKQVSTKAPAVNAWITQEEFTKEIQIARNAGFNDGANHAYKRGWDEHADAISNAIASLPKSPPTLNDARPENPVRRVEPAARAARLPEQAPTVARARQIDGRASSSSEPPLPKAWRAILGVLAQHREGRTKSQLGILSGYSSTSSTFDNALSALRTKEYINRGAPITATDAGLQALGSYDPLPVGKALQEYWLAKLGKAERTLLTCLLKHRGRGISRAQLSQQSQDEFPPGYSDTSSTFDNALSKLRTLELISGRGELRASEDLFA